MVAVAEEVQLVDWLKTLEMDEVKQTTAKVINNDLSIQNPVLDHY